MDFLTKSTYLLDGVSAMAKQGKNQDDLQQLNRSLVVRLIHRMRVCSRAELAKQSGLTKASITGITQHLIDRGIVKEVGLISGANGRRSIGLTLRTEHYLCIGLRLTRQHIRGGLFDVGGELYASQNCRIEPNNNPQDAMRLMKEMIAQLLKQADGRQVLGIGIALPGPVIYKEGKIAFMSAFKGWENVFISSELSEAFHLPVLLEHDGVCYALSEWWNRSPKDEYRLMLCVLAGQGIGAGVIEEGRPIRGALGCAGEIGHMSLDPFGPQCDCGNRGCLEKYSSTLALEREMAEQLMVRKDHPLHGQRPDIKRILSMVNENDGLAVEIFEKQVEYLGYGLVNLVNFLNPDVIVVTDDMAECAGLMEKVLTKVLSERLSPRILEETRLIVRPNSPIMAMQAATSLIVDRFLSHPEEFCQ